jgi:hypothetical protein
MGWVAQILAHDFSARMNMQEPINELGHFDGTPEYQQGWDDARKAAWVILEGQ